MTINLIDYALNVALTGLIYGSEIWIVCAFGTYLVTHTRKSKAINQNNNQKHVQKHTHQPEIEVDCVPGIEIIIEQAPTEQSVVKKSTARFAVQPPQTQHQKQQPALIPLLPTVLPLSAEKAATPPSVPAKSVSMPTELVSTAIVSTAIASTEIICEPVNWKQWKVADLRKASVANVCGVRIRPIGSKRNLPKADLIAQYKQQLKRFTKQPSKRVVEHERIA
ncbi:MAG: hypothetical protein AAFO84_00800 [Cyanobacteria bacterium J06598_1]